MISPDDDMPLPKYTPQNNYDFYTRVVQATSLQLPVLDASLPPFTFNAAEEANYQIQSDIVSCFFTSIEASRDETIKDFIWRGLISPNVRNINRETPLLAAIRVGNIHMLHTLISLGAGVNIVGRPKEKGHQQERTPLQYAYEIGNLTFIKVLMTFGADDSMIAPYGAIALRLAAQNRHSEIVDILPSWRGGVGAKLMAAHRREMMTMIKALHDIKEILSLVWRWPIQFWIVWPDELGLPTRRRRGRFEGWMKRQVKKTSFRVKRFMKGVSVGVRALPESLVRVTRWVRTVLLQLPTTLKTVVGWISDGLKVIGGTNIEDIKRAFSTLHISLIAFTTAFKNITLADTHTGLQYALQALCITLPQAICPFARSFGKISYEVLACLFRSVRKYIWLIARGCRWLVAYFPMKIWICVKALCRLFRFEVEKCSACINSKRA